MACLQNSASLRKTENNKNTICVRSKQKKNSWFVIFVSLIFPSVCLPSVVPLSCFCVGTMLVLEMMCYILGRSAMLQMSKCNVHLKR